MITTLDQLANLPPGTVIIENLPAGEAEAWHKDSDGIWWSGSRGTADGRKIHLPASILMPANGTA